MSVVCNNLFADNAVNQPLIRLIMEDSPQAQHPPVPTPQVNLKGKIVIAFDSNIAGREEGYGYRLTANPACGNTPIREGPSENFWDKVCSQALKPIGQHLIGPFADPSHLPVAHMEPAPTEDPNIPISSFDHIIESSSFLAPPPSFERVIKRKRKPEARSLAHKPLHRCLVAYSRGYATTTKNGLRRPWQYNDLNGLNSTLYPLQLFLK
ncbi:uncharacterized protein A4U43_C01F16310 [Asparagus officinalis]|uniref:Uncharacterized protein n=1 Tax=Asparagus officinalis TaxID=4686 RepID=A0A5P1FPS7_ASPOF|nr:uncharacterized protein A4U43_C01F16310 [Asparagus officinalis]